MRVLGIYLDDLGEFHDRFLGFSRLDECNPLFRMLALARGISFLLLLLRKPGDALRGEKNDYCREYNVSIFQIMHLAPLLDYVFQRLIDCRRAN